MTRDELSRLLASVGNETPSLTAGQIMLMAGVDADGGLSFDDLRGVVLKARLKACFSTMAGARPSVTAAQVRQSFERGGRAPPELSVGCTELDSDLFTQLWLGAEPGTVLSRCSLREGATPVEPSAISPLLDRSVLRSCV